MVPHGAIATTDESTVVLYRSSFLTWIVKINNYGVVQWGTSLSQVGDIYHDSGFGVIQTADGGYAVVGVTDTFGQMAMWKLNSDGAIQWSKTYGAGQLRSIAQASNGGFLVGGILGSSPIIMRTTADGNVVWSKQLGTGNYGRVDGIAPASDGGFGFCIYRNGGYGMSIGRISETGELIWRMVYGDTENAMSIAPTADGGFVAVGSTESLGQTDPDSADTDAMVVRIDGEGTLLWSRSFGVAYRSENFNSAAELANGDIVVAGRSRENGDNGAFIASCDTDGALRWSRWYEEGVGNGGQAFGVAAHPSGTYSILMSGGTSGLSFGGMLSRFSPDGTICAGCAPTSFGMSALEYLDEDAVEVFSPTLNLVAAPYAHISSSGAIGAIGCYVVGVNESTLNSKRVQIFPNPANNRLTVEMDLEAESWLFELSNVDCSVVLTKSIHHQGSTILDISSLAPGVYVARVTGNIAVFCTPLIITR